MVGYSKDIHSLRHDSVPVNDRDATGSSKYIRIRIKRAPQRRIRSITACIAPTIMSSTQGGIETLRALVRTLTEASEQVIEEWEKEDRAPPQRSSAPDTAITAKVPSHQLHEARRTLVSAAGMAIALVQDPAARCMELCGQYLESRALHIAVEKGVADILAESSSEEGVPLEQLSKATGIKEQKLGMRTVNTSSDLS